MTTLTWITEGLLLLFAAYLVVQWVAGLIEGYREGKKEALGKKK